MAHSYGTSTGALAPVKGFIRILLKGKDKLIKIIAII